MTTEWAREWELMGLCYHNQTARPKRQILGVLGAIGSLLSFGLGIKNTKELSDLHEVTQQLSNDRDILLAKLTILEHDFNERFANIVKRHRILDFKEKILELEHRLHQYFYDETNRWRQGMYKLYRGELDPNIISITDMTRGFDRIKHFGRKVGMVPAPIENQIELFFSLPVTAMVQGNDVHVWVSIPFVLKHSPAFEVLRLTHVPVPFGNYMVQLDTSDTYLLIDQQRTVHAEISSVELASCDRHRTSYFCTRDTFYRHSKSCSMSLLHGNKHLASSICKKHVMPAPNVSIHKLPSVNGTRVQIYTAKSMTLMTICATERHIAPVRLRPREHYIHEVPYGCYVKTEDTVTLIPHKPEEASIACQGSEWIARELLEDMDELVIHSTLAENNFTEGKMELPLIKEMLKQKKPMIPKWYMYVLVALGFFVAAVALDLGLRYCLLIKERTQMMKDVVHTYVPCRPPELTEAEKDEQLYIEARSHYDFIKSRRSARKAQTALADEQEEGHYEIPKPTGQEMPKDPVGTRTVAAETHV